ncbi:MAG: winged helix-turn-helix domain-containing protein [Candidatus Korobacteraceae bacterium]
MNPTVFLVEDDSDIAELVRHHLSAAGFGVRAYTGSHHVISDAEKQPPALFLLDVMVPGADGFEVCRRIRQNGKLAAVPIIFVTAKTAEADRIAGLELGADDYITKPFSPKELIARVKAVLRRFERPLPAVQMNIGELEIDGSAMHVRVRGELIETTATEFRLLQYLAGHPGRVFTRDQILDAVWRDTSFVTPRSVDVYIRRLREKIERDPENPQYLKTLRGAGYRFEVPK